MNHKLSFSIIIVISIIIYYKNFFYNNKQFIIDSLFLDIHNIHDYFDIYCAIIPFINEILNLLTICIFYPYFNYNLYPHFPISNAENIRKSIFDTVAVTGIVANASNYGDKYPGKMIGFVKGILYSILTFFLPNLFLYNILKKFKNLISKFIIGILIIYILDVLVIMISKLYILYYNGQFG